MIKKIGYKFRIYPTTEQKDLFEKHFGCCRFIYNYLLAFRKESYEKFKISISWSEAKRKISKLKKMEEYKWLKEVNSQSLQEASLDLEKAYKRFFKGLGRKPRFKKKSQKQTFKVPQHFSLIKSKRGNYFLYLPKLKSGIRVNIHREMEGEIKQITISKSASGKYYASFNCEGEKDVVERKDKKEIGIDLGLTSFIATSDGAKIDPPKFLRRSEKRLASANRSLSRKQKYSSNWHKEKKKVARLHEHVANQRKDFLHKTSFGLISENQAIYLEDLNVKGMMCNRRLAKSIADASWSEFARQLSYKATWRGARIMQIGRFEPSSKLCYDCGAINKELMLCQRMWQCKTCLRMHDRDINAAKNILKIGQDMPELKPVEKPTPVFSLKRKQVDSGKQEPFVKC